ncbi:EF-hand calcium-binding domain-containing protein 6 isoform X2 [Eptesicus fuscus]|uniref:EF-hand calcium-binding domain-containing protein 6 isoform X2 n=1 Tax=Eptesicus fuscus TaxID=29078 RepID=UPI0024047CFC|nr:EF-hand calcium-binding domain-containing protein 6 isoform X2 [Eptesicus fuscus]
MALLKLLCRDLMCKMATIPVWHTPCPHFKKFTNLRPYSSPFRVCSRNGFQNTSRSSSTTTVANPVLSFLDVKRILFQKITDKGDELIKAFQLLDPGRSMTVSKSELRRVVSTFLLPLTREQFQDVLAQISLTSAGAVPYLQFLSRFGGVDLNANLLKRGNGGEVKGGRTLKELETLVGDKISKNIKAVGRALNLIDVNRTGRMQPNELRRVLETFCLRMTEEEYRKFAEYYSINKDASVDYNAFLKNLSINNNLHLKYLGDQGVSWENQQAKTATRDFLLRCSEAPESSWEDRSLDEIGRTFCQELAKCREKVEKALSAGDPSRCGYISLNYLKIVLDSFVYRLPRRIFIPLMKRFGLRTTNRIYWKQFLTLLHDPQWSEAQSSDPPAKKDSTNSRNQCCRENIITKLFRREDHYTLLRKTLLMVNAKVNGQIKGEELQHTINSMVVKLSDSEFKELMQKLDPGGSGLVDINRFLELLEESREKIGKPSSGGDAQAPHQLAWDSVEGMVRDAVSRNLLAFYDLLCSYDLGGTGLIGANNLKKVLHIFCPCLTTEHLAKLCSKFQDSASGKVLYKNLLASMGVPGLPAACPANAAKERPPREPGQQEAPPERAERTKPPEDKSPGTKTVTKDEAVERLRHWVQRQDPAFKKQFLDSSKDVNGRVNSCDFRKVLENQGMPMDDDQYAQLTAAIGYKKEGMNYLDLAAGFEGAKTNGLQVTAPQTSVLPKNSLASFFVTAEECLALLPQRLRESFPNLYAAFFRMDTNRDGIVSMQDLHRLLEHLLFNLKDDQFERLVALLGLRLSVTLNFREFRNLFQETPPTTDDPPQRLIRQKQKVTDSELACEQAHQYLVTKAKNRWTDLSKNFTETDHEGAGILRRRDIKNALYGFDVPLTPRELEKLWMRYDTKGRGHITFPEFLHQLGITYSADVHRPYAEDRSNFMGHFTKPLPQEPPREQRPEQRPAPPPGTDTAAAEPAREKLKDHCEDIRKALTKLDTCGGGSVSLCQLQRALRDSGCPLKEAELAALLGSLGISWQDNSINYLDFLRAVEDSKPSGPEPRESEPGAPVSFAKLSPEEVLKGVQKVVAACGPALATAFSAVDKEDTGFVKASDFGQVLKDFCYKLTDNQFHYFLRKLRLHLTPCIGWKYFLQSFGGFLEENASEWAEKMPKGPPPRSPKEVANREILARLHRAVATRYQAIAQEFQNFDTAKAGTASREEFRAVCTRHVQVLTDEQFDRLWKEMPVTAKGRLRYLDFLSRFSAEKAATPPSSGDSTKGHRRGDVPATSEGGRAVGSSSPTRDPPKTGAKPRSQPCTASSMGSVLGTPQLQNCEPIESRLRKRVQGCWRELLRECKERDTHRQGDIPAADFLALAEKFKLDLSKEESQQLTVKYDLKDNGRFAYCDFLQSCVLLLRAKETSLMQRMKIQNADKMEEAGAETSSFYSALLRIQPKIMHCWRPMRRTFKSYDEGGTGFVGVTDFRKVLRQYSINLSEEEFFHILEYYDKTLSSRLSYNDFLRAFLQ